VFCTVSLRPSGASEFVLWFLCSSWCSLCSFLCSCFKSLFVFLSSLLTVQNTSWALYTSCTYHDADCCLKLKIKYINSWPECLLSLHRCKIIMLYSLFVGDIWYKGEHSILLCPLCSFLCSCFKSLFVFLSSFFWPQYSVNPLVSSIFLRMVYVCFLVDFVPCIRVCIWLVRIVSTTTQKTT
jgi:hypothetical protein